MSNEETSKTSITLFKTPSWGILGMAFLIMLTAKCFGYKEDLSWWIVTAPLWGPFALGIAFFVISYACILSIAFVVLACVWIFSGISAIAKFIVKPFRKKN